MVKPLFDWEIQRLEDGEYVLAVRDLDFLEDKPYTLQVKCEVAEGDFVGYKISAFCPLDKNFGKAKLAALIMATGLGEELIKKGKLPDPKEEEWDDDLFDIDTKKGKSFIGMLQNRLIDREFLGTVKTQEYDGKEYTNIVKIAPVPPAPKPSEAVNDTEDDGDDW